MISSDYSVVNKYNLNKYIIKISIDQFFFHIVEKAMIFSKFKVKLSFGLHLFYACFQLLLNKTFLFKFLSVFSIFKYYKKLADKFSINYY